MKDHVDSWYVTKNTHVEEDHVNGQHVIWNLNIEDYVDGWHVTGIITVKDHGNRHYVINITAAQQQPRDLRPAGELNTINRQDHRIINIEELLNDWLGEAVWLLTTDR